MQGTFSYWRAYSEYKKPYITDIGYTEKFTNYFINYCKSGSNAIILNPKGFHFFKSSDNIHGKNYCGELILVMRDHYDKSKIIK